jgi:hypothetical protein
MTAILKTSTEAELLEEIQTKVLRVFLFAIHTVTSTALPCDFYFFKFTQPLTVSIVQLLYTVAYLLTYGLRNP